MMWFICLMLLIIVFLVVWLDGFILVLSCNCVSGVCRLCEMFVSISVWLVLSCLRLCIIWLKLWLVLVVMFILCLGSGLGVWFELIWCVVSVSCENGWFMRFVMNVELNSDSVSVNSF